VLNQLCYSDNEW